MHAYNKLWTKTAFAKVPNIGDQDVKGDAAIAYVKIFSIRSDQRWYVLEYDPETGRAFCLLTDRGESSYGYSPINGNDWDGESMMDVSNKMVVPPFERDPYFEPTTVAIIRGKNGN